MKPEDVEAVANAAAWLEDLNSETGTLQALGTARTSVSSPVGSPERVQELGEVMEAAMPLVSTVLSGAQEHLQALDGVPGEGAEELRSSIERLRHDMDAYTEAAEQWRPTIKQVSQKAKKKRRSLKRRN